MIWDQILLIIESDPNNSMNNLHQHINYLLDEYKLRFKPWINKNISGHMKNVINY